MSDNKWIKKSVKYFDTFVILQSKFQALWWFYFLQIISNLGAYFCTPKSGDSSQKQLVLPPDRKDQISSGTSVT